MALLLRIIIWSLTFGERTLPSFFTSKIVWLLKLKMAQWSWYPELFPRVLIPQY